MKLDVDNVIVASPEGSSLLASQYLKYLRLFQPYFLYNNYVYDNS